MMRCAEKAGRTTVASMEAFIRCGRKIVKSLYRIV
jgi:hypothetical protein